MRKDLLSDLGKLGEIIRLLEEAGITELSVEGDGYKIYIRRGGAGAGAEEEKEEGLLEIKAPMVGTFYRAPAPDKPPYIEEGQVIERGQVIGIIEAMKLMNEIESPYRGKVVKILVGNGEPVEYGQPLVLLEPMPEG